MSLFPVRRTLAAVLCLALLPHHALAAQLAAPAPRGARVGAPSISIPRLSTPVSIGREAVVAPSAAFSIEQAGPAAIAIEAAAASQQIGQTLQTVGPIERADAGSAHSAGHTVQDILNRRSLPTHGDVTPMGANFELDQPYLAKPAGKDSIDAPARMLFGGAPANASANDTPTPPAPPQGPREGDGDGNGGGPQSAPLIPRIMTAALALAPALLLGWPLFAAGSTVAGVLVMAGSAGVAALPFMSERSSSLLKAAPGVVIAGLGLYTLAAGVSAGLAVGAMGFVVALGAWGFIRFALGEGRKTGATDILASFFGALGAVTGAGVVLLNPAGWIATGVMILAYPATMILFMHLPGWIGRGMEQAFRGYEVGVRENYHVARSISRDTTARKRLEAYSNAAVNRSSWNAIWLGLLVWLPIGIVELGRAVFGVGAGLVNATLRAPFMFAWGASARLSDKGGAQRFFAGWARASAWMTKGSTFNNLEKPLIGLANSDKLVVRAFGGLAITVAQLGWTIGSVVFTVLGVLLGWIDGLRQARSAYDEKKHDPREYRLDADPLPSQVPEVPKPQVTMALPAKLIAAAIGLSPLWWFLTPLLSTGIFGWLALAGIFAVGLMPLMPGTSNLPSTLRRLPGTLMIFTGGGALIGGLQAWFTLIGLPTGFVLPLAALAVVGGYALHRLVDGLLDEKKSAYDLDRAEYIAGYAGALAIHTALSAALLGVSGTVGMALTGLAFLLSPFLLYHLPRELWSGLWGSLAGLWKAPSKVSDVMGFWRGETQFNANLSAFYRSWTRKSFWYGTMFIPHFLVTFVAYAGEFAASVVVGLLAGVTRMPSLFMYAFRSAQKHDSANTKFWAGFNGYLSRKIEGSKKEAFDPLVAALKEPMSGKRPSSHPTGKALAALTGARFVQAWWLIRTSVMALLTPLLWIPAWQAGKRAMTEEFPRPWN